MNDSPPPGVSLADLLATARSVWQALIAPPVLAVAAFLWQAYKWLRQRRDARDKGHDEDFVRRVEADARERAQLSSDMQQFIDRLTRRIVELEAIERHLTGCWVESRDAANTARQMVNALERQAGQPPTPWPAWQ